MDSVSHRKGKVRALRIRAPVILIVDDEEDHLGVVSEVLTQTLRGSRILQATSVRDAKKQLRAQDVDVIVTDYRFPEEDGLDLVEHVHQTQPSVGTILMTAYANVDMTVRAVNGGHVDAIFLKPFNPEHLAQRVHEVILEKWAREAAAKVLDS